MPTAWALVTSSIGRFSRGLPSAVIAMLVARIALATPDGTPTAAEEPAAPTTPAQREPKTIEELGQEFGWEELPPAPPTTTAPIENAELTRRRSPRGWSFGARLLSDLAHLALDLPVTGEAHAVWSGADFGASAGLLLSRPLGLRVDGRVYGLRRGVVRPYVGAGLSFYFPDLGVRGLAGAEWKIVDPLVVGLEMAVEHYALRSDEFRDTAAILGVSVAYNL